MSSQTYDPLIGAATVALVVHGVDAHTDIDICETAKEGFLAYTKNEITSDTLKVPGLPSINQFQDYRTGARKREKQGNPFTDFRALVIKNQGKHHIVLPLIWSGIRHRSAKMARSQINVFPTDRIAASIPMLLAAFLSAFACVPRARGTLWKAGVFIAALVFITLIVALVGLIFFFACWLLLVAFSPLTDPRWGKIVAFILFIIVGFSVAIPLRIVDLVADVPSYVGRCKLRYRVMGELHEIIKEVRKRSPNAKILVIGHSLGSVLVTHTLLEPLPVTQGSPGLVLVTCGSPIRMMSTVFKDILPPKDLATELCERGLVDHWANYWRDGDFIGKALGILDLQNCSESSLGPGGHSNYWASATLWERIAKLALSP